METARDLAADLRDSEKPVRIFIVDSLTAHFRAEYAGRGTLAARQQKLNRHMHDLFKLVDENNAVALVTNQVMSNPAVFFGDPTKPIGGNIVGHTATFRIYLRKSKGGKRIARLVDSPNLPDGEATFMVEQAGLKPC
jgi:DNA repair protein RadA